MINYLHKPVQVFKYAVKEFIIYVLLFNQCLSVILDFVRGVVKTGFL